MDSTYNEINNKVKFFANTDEKLKFLGKVFSNDTSRKIFALLLQQDMTANQISQKTNLSLSLIIHHINNMLSSELVTIHRVSYNSKNQLMKHYKAKPVILIFPEIMINNAQTSKGFYRSLKTIMRFASIGFAGLVTWFITQPSPQILESSTVSTFDNITPVLISSGVILCGVVINYIIKSKK